MYVAFMLSVLVYCILHHTIAYEYALSLDFVQLCSYTLVSVRPQVLSAFQITFELGGIRVLLSRKMERLNTSLLHNHL